VKNAVDGEASISVCLSLVSRLALDRWQISQNACVLRIRLLVSRRIDDWDETSFV
jgi:hypothetical protein